MVKKILLHKKNQVIYRISNESNDSIMGLIYFLKDGVGSDYYVNFLLDESRKECGGNISWLEKNGDTVSIEIDDYVYPNTPIFTTTIDNLLTILKDYRDLLRAKADTIEIVIDENDQVFIKGE